MGQKHMIFTPDRNTDGSDYTGAFKPESERYARWYEGQGDTVEVHAININAERWERVDAMERAIDGAHGIDRLAFFCHGWKTGMQLGLRCDTEDDRERLLMFAGHVYRQSTAQLKVSLYACLTGKGGADSFANELFKALRFRGCADVSVFGHTDAGHATRNADAIIFSADHPDGEVVAQPRTPMNRHFDKRLDDKTDSLRWRAPYMTVEALRDELRVSSWPSSRAT